MRGDSSRVQVTRSNDDKRQFSRSRVLLGAVVVTTDGARAFDCTIRDLSVSGASVHPATDLPVGDRIFLLDTRNLIAYLAIIKWKTMKGSGVEFARNYDLTAELPNEVSFLEKLLIEAKLRHILKLVRRGVQLEHAASIVGFTRKHFSKVDAHNGIAAEFGSLLHQLLPLVEKGVLSPTQTQKHENGGGQYRFFQRRPSTEP